MTNSLMRGRVRGVGRSCTCNIDRKTSNDARRQLLRDIHEAMCAALAEDARRVALRRGPRVSGIREQRVAFVRERKRAAATIAAWRAFGNPALGDQRLQVPCQRRALVKIASAQV